MTFRSQSETFIGRSKSFFLSVLATVRWKNGKNLVVHMTQCATQGIDPKLEKLSETVARVLRKHQVPVAIRPFNTLKRKLVHQKDKQEKEEKTECVYKSPCGNNEKTYVGETGRKFGVRLKEHRTEVESKSRKAFTRSQHAASLTERNKSALTDHEVQENNVINWSEATVIGREPDRGTRRIKEQFVSGRKEKDQRTGTRAATHRVYDKVLATLPPERGKNRKKTLFTSSDEGL